MAAPKGNKNAVGNRGGGRRSAYQEKFDAKYFREMFFNDTSLEELQAKIRSGKYSPKDAFLLKALTGRGPALLNLFNKISPDGVMSKRDPELPNEPSSPQ